MLASPTLMPVDYSILQCSINQQGWYQLLINKHRMGMLSQARFTTRAFK